MTYRDMTFCAGDGCTRFKTCFRALTNEVQEKAEKLGLPISQFVTPTELDCYRKDEDETNRITSTQNETNKKTGQ
jgi:hypothetical protein